MSSPSQALAPRASAHPVVEDLHRLLGAGSVVVDPDLLATYRHDAAALCDAQLPMVAVLPTSETEVQDTMRLASTHRIPVVPQGALTGLAGAANAISGCIVLNSRRLNQVVEVDAENRVAIVEPGVTNAELRQAAARVGLTYRPDPSSWESSTLGGNIATNAGGLCCVKYGVTARFVRGLRVVLADGRVMAVGRRTVKGVAGLNLTDLFIGSEGTLGVITQAVVGLEATAADPLTLAATFPDAASAGRACAEIRSAGITPSLFELLDRTTLAAINKHTRMGLDEEAGALLIAQSDAGPSAAGEIEQMAQRCTAEGAFDVAVGEDSQESEQLVEARRLAYPAMEALGATLVDDVAVPLSELGRIIVEIERIAERFGLLIGVVGHAGDGNLHPTTVIDPADPQCLERAHLASEEIAEFALGLGGTITGEHGVGLLKRSLLEKEIDPVALDVQRSIKELLDPHHLLNPGKVLAPLRGAESTW